MQQSLASHPGLKPPSALELTEVVDQVLGDWAFLSAQPAGKPVEGPADLPLEYGILLRGPLTCLLVLRATAALGAELAHANTGDRKAREQGRDAFRELCNLVAGHLLTHCLDGGQQGYQPFLPEPSQPEAWPEGLPNVQCAMIIESHPLEARLWVDPVWDLSRG